MTDTVGAKDAEPTRERAAAADGLAQEDVGSEALLDTAVIGEIAAAGGPALLSAVATSAGAEAENELDRLADARAQGSLDACEASVHALKGTAASLGVAALAAAAEDVLATIRAGVLPDTEAEAGLRHGWRVGFAAFRAFVEKLQADDVRTA